MNTIIHWLEHLNVLMPPDILPWWGQATAKAFGRNGCYIKPVSPGDVDRSGALAVCDAAAHIERVGRTCSTLRNTQCLGWSTTRHGFLFVTSSQQESGLLEPQSLLNLWPNLQTEEIRELMPLLWTPCMVIWVKTPSSQWANDTG
jgi:hypothetical protein